jgi:hypothetical protein
MNRENVNIFVNVTVLTSSCAETKDSGEDVTAVLASPWRRVELSVRNNTDRCNETKVHVEVQVVHTTALRCAVQSHRYVVFCSPN